MREHVNAANATTSASLAAGFGALLLVADGHLGWGVALILLAAVLDGVDGLVARRFGLSGQFGSNLDSLADMVAFGVVPAYMLTQGALSGVPVLGGLASVLFALAGAWRLARFPLVENRDHWVGLPIPTGGFLAASAAAFGSGLPAGLVLAITVGLAALMISTVPFPNFTVLAPLAARARARTAASGGGARTEEELFLAAHRDEDGDTADWDIVAHKRPNRRARVRSRMAGRRRVRLRLRRRRTPAPVDQ